MNVFLPIKPRFAFAISSGEKKYEFRKKNLNRTIEKIVVYASSPYKKIIGYFNVKDVHEDSPKRLWNRFKECAGIDKSEFFEYYENNEKGISIEVDNFIPFKRHLKPAEVFENFSIPQSFRYLSEKDFNQLLECDDI